ncbi:unnamed protein product [Hymenolepis diminuta]|uniref:Uncharacterized protein n=1 Tax=Hymenolepis diminuta TaxID=6216 RepID=A0A564YVW7_HYMDI|nr:unnamed protein product [Hymenolepis diminuta]
MSVIGSSASSSLPFFLGTLLSLSPSITRFKLIVASLNTFWSNQLLVFCFIIVVSSYSNSYELVTVIAGVIADVSCEPSVVISTPTIPAVFIILIISNYILLRLKSWTKCFESPVQYGISFQILPDYFRY